MVDVSHSRLVAAVVGVVLVATVVGGAFVGGFVDPLLGGETETPMPATTSTPSGQAGSGGDGGVGSGDSGGGSGGGDASTGGGDGSAATPPAYAFRFQILRTEACGTTCRDVTVRLTNGGSETATGVRATSRILVEGDVLWTGTENIGDVGPGESVTRTRRVELGFAEAVRIQQNDGYVTIETTVTWDEGSRTFSQREKVI